MLGDLVCNATFTKRDFDREKKVILQEIAMTDDNPEEYLYDQFFESIYGDAALGYPILGNEETINNVNRNTLTAFYRARYQPQHIIVSAAGPLRHSEVVRLVRQHFKFKKVTNKFSVMPPRRKPTFYPVREVFPKDSEQVHLLAGFPCMSFEDERRYVAFVLNAWLGGGMTSKLYQSIRERKGLAYSVYSNLTTFNDCGTLSIYAGTDAKC